MSKFAPGQSGNPKGKPVGTRHRATTLIMSLMETNAQSIADAVVAAAKSGDMGAARMILDRLAPAVKERSISLILPDTGTAQGVAEASAAVLKAVGEGTITPGEGTAVSGILEARRRAIETMELEQRITALEEGQHVQT
jgi:hypothetical protein